EVPLGGDNGEDLDVLGVAVAAGVGEGAGLDGERVGPGREGAGEVVAVGVAQPDAFGPGEADGPGRPGEDELGAVDGRVVEGEAGDRREADLEVAPVVDDVATDADPCEQDRSGGPGGDGRGGWADDLEGLGE